MKKKIILLAACVAALGTYIGYSHARSEVTDLLMLENVEALAGGEIAPEVQCVASGSVDCPKNHIKVAYVFSGYSLD